MYSTTTPGYTNDSTSYPDSMATMTSSVGTTTGAPPVSTYLIETITLCLMWPFSVWGNTLVCIVIHRSRRLQSTTNYFVVSLAAADLVLAALCMPFILGRVISGQWVFGKLMCKLVRFLQYLVPGCTMLVFVAICIDRFYTIIYPLSFKVTRYRAKQLICLSWFIAMLLACPSFYFYDVVLIDGVEFCQTYIESTWGGIFYVCFMFVALVVVPITLLVVVYSKIFRFIWQAGIGGRTFQRTFNPVPRPKVKIVKMIMVVTGITICFMLPFFVVQLWYCSQDGTNVNPSVYIGVVWTYFAGSVSKPTMYVCYNSNFRRGCKEVFCMSNMRCYRGNAYTITTASHLSKKNHVGIIDNMSSSDYLRVGSPSKTFDRSAVMDKHSWPIGNNAPSTYL